MRGRRSGVVGVVERAKYVRHSYVEITIILSEKTTRTA